MGNPRIWIAAASLLWVAMPVAADIKDESDLAESREAMPELEMDAVTGASTAPSATAHGQGQAECAPEAADQIESLGDTRDAVRATSQLLATPFSIEKGCYPEDVRKKKGLEKNGCWYPEYDLFIDELLKGDPSLEGDSPFLKGPSPAGVEEVCPRYPELSPEERRIFWRYLFQAMTGAESGFVKHKRHPEKWRIHDGKVVWPGERNFEKGEKVVSEGLFQLSFSDAKNHRGECRFSRRSPKSIFDPKKNLQCGVAILRKQLFDRSPVVEEGTGKIVGYVNLSNKGLFHPGSYWSILRKKKGKAQVNSCLRKIPGYRRDDLSRVPEEFLPNVTACQGFSGRKVLAQFWEGYPNRTGVGKSLCGRKNLLDFCGTLECAELPKSKAKTKAKAKAGPSRGRSR